MTSKKKLRRKIKELEEELVDLRHISAGALLKLMEQTGREPGGKRLTTGRAD